ncbi:hypothetical protein N7489_004824 [Penicillium chrysogenum]|uniref:uncharacterized protein n=1 Tax=Penicillium chrysogenum TaxID=5076 RepID=UPI0024DF0FD7|nr:uncharacterized protein N7489_004824 [Penicillium chrysogenum]KAJ5244728.1 hypothetical protein N7489_004824 [Penicillium chrysogenum]
MIAASCVPFPADKTMTDGDPPDYKPLFSQETRRKEAGSSQKQAEDQVKQAHDERKQDKERTRATNLGNSFGQSHVGQSHTYPPDP